MPNSNRRKTLLMQARRHLLSRWVWLGLSGCIVLGVALILWVITSRGNPVSDREVLTKIQSLAEAGDGAEALRLSVYTFPVKAEPELQQDWAQFEVSLAAQLRQLNRVAYWAQRAPRLLKDDEQASLNWVRALMHERRAQPALEVIEEWLAISDNQPLWLLTKADVLILQGNLEAAKAVLDSEVFLGREEAFRLMRLAILEAGKPEAVNRAMTAALQAAPDLADLRAFLGELFEKRGDYASAERELLFAYRLEPTSPVWQNMLVDFYLRRGQYHPAVRLMQNLPAEEMTAELWLKQTFVTRLVTGRDTSALPLTRTPQFKAVATLQAHPTAVFWPNKEQAPQAWSVHAFRRPEAVWLGFFALLEAGHEAEAAHFLSQHEAMMKRFSWVGHEAYAALLSLRVPEASLRRDFAMTMSAKTHPAFIELKAALEKAEGTQKDFYRHSPHAFGALALALGWFEAALALTNEMTTDTISLSWWDYSYAQALRYNRSPTTALSYLAAQSSRSRAAECLLGELLLGAGRPDEAHTVFSGLQDLPDGASYRAAWLQSMSALEQGDNARVKTIIQDYAGLAQTPLQRDLRLILGESAELLEQAMPSDASTLEIAYRLRRALLSQDQLAVRRLAKTLQAQNPHSPRLRRFVTELTERASFPPEGNES